MVVKKKTVSKTTTKAKTTKSTVKKKTTTKTTKTKVAAKSTVTKSTTEITVSGNKKTGTLQKEFNKKFPYLRLGIYYSYARDQVKKGETIHQISGDKTLAQVRRADGGGSISISGNKRVGTLEKEFDTVLDYTAKYAILIPPVIAIILPVLVILTRCLLLIKRLRQKVERKENGNKLTEL